MTLFFAGNTIDNFHFSIQDDSKQVIQIVRISWESREYGRKQISHRKFGPQMEVWVCRGLINIYINTNAYTFMSGQKKRKKTFLEYTEYLRDLFIILLNFGWNLNFVTILSFFNTNSFSNYKKKNLVFFLNYYWVKFLICDNERIWLLCDKQTLNIRHFYQFHIEYSNIKFIELFSIFLIRAEN